MRQSFLSRVLSHAARGCWLAAGIAGGVVLGWVGARSVGEPALEPLATIRNGFTDPPPSTTAANQSATDEFARTVDLYERVRDADAADIEQLFEESATIARSDERLDAWTVLYARWASLDPSAALDHALSHGALIETAWSRAWVHSIFSTWARNNPTEATHRLDLLPPSVLMLATASVLGATLPGDEHRAVLELLGVPATATLQLPSPDWVVRVANDPAGALHEALRDDIPGWGVSRAREVALTLASRDPAAAMTLVSAGEPLPQRDQIMAEIAALWAKRSSQEVIDWGLTQPPSNVRSEVLAAALATLALRAPAAALEMASTLSDAREQRVVLNRVLPSWASVDPAAATAWYELADRSLRATTLQGVVSAYARSDASAALAWVMKLPPDESARGLSMLMTSFVFKDTLRASAMVMDIPAGAARDSAASAVVAVWAHKDPQAAWRWARRYGDSAISGDLLALVLGAWSYQDLRSANRALRSLDDSPLFDRAAIGVLTTAQEGDELLVIYERISDPGLKAQAARRVHEALGYTDPVLAEEFATSAGIADASP